jgi:hypothetical protein
MIKEHNMNCPKCGTQNSENAQACSSCGQNLIVPSEIPQIPKTSAWAKWSFNFAVINFIAIICSILLFIVIIFSIDVIGLRIKPYIGDALWIIFLIIFIPTLTITPFLALICGIISLVKIRRSNRRLKGNGCAVTGITFPIIQIILLAILTPAMGRASPTCQQIMCSANIKNFGLCISAYTAKHNNMYPPANSWYDEIVKDFHVGREWLHCPVDSKIKGDKSSYAFNINLVGRKASEVPPDTVLLFETNPAINPVGGPEILSGKKHHKDHNIYHSWGSNIVFADYHVEFVKEEDFSKLRWKPD